MTHIAYTHTLSTPLIVAMTRWIRQLLRVPSSTFPRRSTRGSWRSRVMVAAGWLIVLVTQAALILAVQELITLCHGVIDLYLELAGLQLDLTSAYVAATSPGK